jgi:hypothetical protein
VRKAARDPFVVGSIADWKEAPDGQVHLRRIADITGGGSPDAVLLNRKELTRALEEALGAAEARPGHLGFEESDAFRARRRVLLDRRLASSGATGRVFSRGVGGAGSPVLGETRHTFTPSSEEVSALAGAGISTPEIIETASGDAFHRAIVTASEALEDPRLDGPALREGVDEGTTLGLIGAPLTFQVGSD